MPEDPAFSIPDFGYFDFGTYVRNTICNSVSYLNMCFRPKFNIYIKQFFGNFRRKRTDKIRHTVANSTPDIRPRIKSKWQMSGVLKAGLPVISK